MSDHPEKAKRRKRLCLGISCLGCGVVGGFLLMVFAVILFVFLRPFLFYASEEGRGRKVGTMDEILASETNFYTMHSEWDSWRAPLRYPYELNTLTRDANPDLMWERKFIVEAVESIGYQKGYFAGVGRKRTFRDTAPAEPQWFLITPEATHLLFDSQEAFEACLQQKSLAPFTFFPALDFVHTFERDDSCLPVYNRAEIFPSITFPGDNPVTSPKP